VSLDAEPMAVSPGLPPSDLELVRRYKASLDPTHVGELYGRYAHLALGVCLRYLRNREDAEDAVMEIYERLLSALRKHEVDNFKSWLYSVAANHCRMALRRRKGSPVAVEMTDELLDATLASVPAALEEDEDEARLQALGPALAQLGEGQKRCIELFYLEGRSYAEVAVTTGYSLGEVKSHIQNGKRKLRIVLTSTAP
jgi:RNA polymerase sigma-70 factor (ECF subfamily)